MKVINTPSFYLFDPPDPFHPANPANLANLEFCGKLVNWLSNTIITGFYQELFWKISHSMQCHVAASQNNKRDERGSLEDYKNRANM